MKLPTYLRYVLSIFCVLFAVSIVFLAWKYRPRSTEPPEVSILRNYAKAVGAESWEVRREQKPGPYACSMWISTTLDVTVSADGPTCQDTLNKVVRNEVQTMRRPIFEHWRSR